MSKNNKYYCSGIGSAPDVCFAYTALSKNVSQPSLCIARRASLPVLALLLENCSTKWYAGDRFTYTNRRRYIASSQEKRALFVLRVNRTFCSSIGLNRDSCVRASGETFRTVGKYALEGKRKVCLIGEPTCRHPDGILPSPAPPRHAGGMSGFWTRSVHCPTSQIVFKIINNRGASYSNTYFLYGQNSKRFSITE